MLQFLSDDVARINQNNLLREAAAHERATEATRESQVGHRSPQLRIRAGSLLLSLGSRLLVSGGTSVLIRLEDAS
jgi:hypothetical protein